MMQLIGHINLLMNENRPKIHPIDRMKLLIISSQL